jgi:sterol desaturase/sphingolipid hydroxylase (fatty acid hydroxylase superfamily)
MGDPCPKAKLQTGRQPLSILSPFSESGLDGAHWPQAVAMLGSREAVFIIEGAFILNFALIAVSAPIFLSELWSLAKKGQLDRRRVTGVATNAFCFLPTKLTETILLAIVSWFFLHASALAPLKAPTTVLTAAICLILADLIYYWEHRLAHEVNALWSLYHSVHHSADHFDQSVAWRLSFINNFAEPLFYLPLAVLGFHPMLVFACVAVIRAYQQWIHTELIGKLPLLDPWFNTPSNHRVHHARDEMYLDRNHGGILMLWDRLFGTYQPEGQPVHYGLVTPLAERNPLAVHFHLLWRLLKDLAAAGSQKKIMKLLLGKPSELDGLADQALNAP